LADIAEMFHREHGVQAAVEAAVKRRGRLLDPALVDEFRRLAPDVLPTLGSESSWDEVIAAEPVSRAPLTEPELEVALEAIADFTDLKSVYFSGHSRGVAKLAAEARTQRGFSRPRRCRRTTGRVGPRPRAQRSAQHDLGQAGSAHLSRVGAGPAAPVLHRTGARTGTCPAPGRRDRRRTTPSRRWRTSSRAAPTARSSSRSTDNRWGAAGPKNGGTNRAAVSPYARRLGPRLGRAPSSDQQDRDCREDHDRGGWRVLAQRARRSVPGHIGRA
jgi:hypothetical protein